MVRTILLAVLVSLVGAGASRAQYTDSAPPDAPYVADDSAPYEGYDYELLGDPDEYADDQRYDGGYDRPDTDVGMFISLGSDGRWFFQASYGWVWRPYAPVSWRPYQHGRWVWTSVGWNWVSYEPFGWAVYHYGSWVNDPVMGWVWIPGYEWAACRARFAYYDDYICWAPMAPAGYYYPDPWSHAGVSIWFTIGASHFYDPYPARYCVRPAYRADYRPRVAYKSPGRGWVEHYTRTPIHTSKVAFKHTRFSRDGGEYAMNSRSRSTTTREFQSRRPTTMRDVMKQPRATREMRGTRSTQPRVSRDIRAPRTITPQKQQVTRRSVEPRRSFEARRTVTQKQQMTRRGPAPRERSIAPQQRAPRNSFEQRSREVTRKAFHAPRTNPRMQKSVVSEKKSERREVTRTRGSSGKGRGKAR